jgi:hypothetical protein
MDIDDLDCSKTRDVNAMFEKNRRLKNQVTFLQIKQKQKREELRKMKRRGMCNVIVKSVRTIPNIGLME